MSTPTLHCGRVTLVGRPNVGKSTLLNALVGAHVSIVSPRPQTTRHRILGVCTQAQGQVVLVDTPGLHGDGRRALNQSLNRAVHAALAEVDLALQVIEAGRWSDEDAAVHAALQAAALPSLLVLNKIDRMPDKSALLPFVQDLLPRLTVLGVHYVSARRRQGLDALCADVFARLPVREPEFAADDLTDRSERFLAAELLREQLMLRLGEELPYATTVEIERFHERADGLAEIDAVIWVEREGQRAIVIGRGGEMLKLIGAAARRAMEQLFGRRVFLSTWVKVRAGWSDDPAALRRFGYTD